MTTLATMAEIDDPEELRRAVAAAVKGGQSDALAVEALEELDALAQGGGRAQGARGSTCSRASQTRSRHKAGVQAPGLRPGDGGQPLGPRRVERGDEGCATSG